MPGGDDIAEELVRSLTGKVVRHTVERGLEEHVYDFSYDAFRASGRG